MWSPGLVWTILRYAVNNSSVLGFFLHPRESFSCCQAQPTWAIWGLIWTQPCSETHRRVDEQVGYGVGSWCLPTETRPQHNISFMIRTSVISSQPSTLLRQWTSVFFFLFHQMLFFPIPLYLRIFTAWFSRCLVDVFGITQRGKNTYTQMHLHLLYAKPLMHSVVVLGKSKWLMNSSVVCLPGCS